jgi:hypothetical protein
VFPKPRLTITPKAGYGFRARVPRDVVAAKLANEVRAIAYINVKDTVTGTRPTWLAGSKLAAESGTRRDSDRRFCRCC